MEGVFSRLGTSLVDTPSIEQLCALTDKLLKEKKEIDTNFRAQLRRLIQASGLTYSVWAERFGIRESALFEMMTTDCSIPAWFWESVERYFKSQTKG